MNVIFLLIAASTLVAVLFLAAFTWAVRSGQFDDDRSPGVRILGDADPAPPGVRHTTTNSND
jgi:cbb3-type cytochrome oxidase maturation protein